MEPYPTCLGVASIDLNKFDPMFDDMVHQLIEALIRQIAQSRKDEGAFWNLPSFGIQNVKDEIYRSHHTQHQQRPGTLFR